MSFKLYPVTHRAEECNDYEVKINGCVAEPDSSRVSACPFNRPWPGYQRQISQTELVNFISYETDEPVTFEITPKQPFESVVIRPLSLGIKPEISDGVIRFTVNKPAYFTVEPYGISKALHVFGDPVSSYDIDFNDENVIYFGKGEHDAGHIELKSNQTLFIDEGAVVYACVHAIDADNIKILGRGILDNSKNLERTSPDDKTLDFRPHTICLEYCTNITIEGIIIRESLHYNIKPKACENVRVSNVKIIGSWKHNTDGFDINNCKNVVIDNCFMRTFDDGVTVKGMDFLYNDKPLDFDDIRKNFDQRVYEATHRGGKVYDTASNIRVRNCTIWCDYSSGFAVGAETLAEEMYDIIFEDSDVIHFNCAAMESHNVDYAHIHDVIFRNINVEYDDVVLTPAGQESDDQKYENTNPDWNPYLLSVRTVCHERYSHGTRRGKTDNITFRNIRMSGIHPPKVMFKGVDEEHMSKDIFIENLHWNGKHLTNWDEFTIEKNEFIKNIDLK